MLHLSLRSGQANRKAGPLTGPAVQVDAPAMPLDDALSNCEAKAGPAVSGCHKRVEYSLAVLQGYARAVIADQDMHFLRRCAQRDLERSTVRHGLKSIEDQVK